MIYYGCYIKYDEKIAEELDELIDDQLDGRIERVVNPYSRDENVNFPDGLELIGVGFVPPSRGFYVGSDDEEICVPSFKYGLDPNKAVNDFETEFPKLVRLCQEKFGDTVRFSEPTWFEGKTLNTYYVEGPICKWIGQGPSLPKWLVLYVKLRENIYQLFGRDNESGEDKSEEDEAREHPTSSEVKLMKGWIDILSRNISNDCVSIEREQYQKPLTAGLRERYQTLLERIAKIRSAWQEPSGQTFDFGTLQRHTLYRQIQSDIRTADFNLAHLIKSISDDCLPRARPIENPDTSLPDTTI